MQCEHIQRELIAFYHGKLSPQERAAIQAHLSSCEACAEEATAMNEMGDLLSKGLKDWVNQGACPPDVVERIERSLRAIRRRPWWQRWPAVVGAAAAVAAVLIVVLASQPQIAQQMASMPLIGALAAQLVDPDVEIQLNPQRPVAAKLFRPTRTVDLNIAATADGVTLTLVRVAADSELLRVQYVIQGEGLVLPADRTLLVPTLDNKAGPIPVRSLAADRRGDEIHFVVYFDAISEGEKLTLTVPALMTEDGGRKGPWTVNFTN